MNLQQQIEERLREQTEVIQLVNLEVSRIQATIARFRQMVGPKLSVSTSDLCGCYRPKGSGYCYAIEQVLSYATNVPEWTFDEQAEFLNRIRLYTDEAIERCYCDAVAKQPVQPDYRSISGRAESLKPANA
jgi:hypothetical protein